MWNLASSASATAPEARCDPQKPLPGDSNTNRWRQFSCLIVGQTINDVVFDPPLPPDIFFSPTNDIQICGVSDRAHKGNKPRYAASKGKEKGYRGEEWEDKATRCSAKYATTAGAVGLRDSSKRTADDAGLNDGDESAHRREKVQCASGCVNLHCRGRV